jgi:hypothetical protein
MGGKKVDTKFTIQFNRYDPTHLRAVEILNRMERFSKAHHIAKALLHYETCNESSESKLTSKVDEKAIDAAVQRVLREKGNHIAEKPVGQSNPYPNAFNEKPTVTVEEIDFNEAVEALDEESLTKMADALDMFLKK